MAITKVRAPDGSIIRVNHPDDADEEDILAFASSQFTPQPQARGVGEEGTFGDSIKALEVGARESIRRTGSRFV